MQLTGPGSAIDRVLGLPPVVVVRRTLEVYGFGGGILAAGLAYRSLFALLSASLLIAGIVGLIVRDPQHQAEIIDAVGARFPPLAPLLKTGLEGVASGAVQFSIIGLAGLAWGVSGVYGTLDIAMARVYGREQGRGFAIRTIRGLLLVAALILGIVLAALATTLSLTIDILSGPGTPSVLQSFVGIVSPIVSVAFYVGVVALVYRFVPPTAPSWRALSVPAVAMGIAFAVFNTVFVRLQSYLLGSFQLFAAFAVVLATMIWLSIGFQILLVGASWIRARDEGTPLLLPSPPAETTSPPSGEEDSVRR
ncbi:MAG: YihY/virulence factor BrkB family protein [Candidatus Limnocylindrales bacterium]